MASYESFATVYDAFMDQTPYDEWKHKIEDILKRYHVESGQSIVDLGCGTGKMTRRLKSAGYEVVGMDNSMEMLEVAASHGDDILYVHQDMRELDLPYEVDAMVSICDCMNYILEEEDLIQVLFHVKQFLKDDGIFIFDMNTRYKYETLLAENTFAENRDDCSFIWENFYDPMDQINEYQLTLFIENENQSFDKFEELHFQRGYSMEEVKNFIKVSGLCLKEVLDVDTMEQPTKSSERVYYIVSNER